MKNARTPKIARTPRTEHGVKQEESLTNFGGFLGARARAGRKTASRARARARARARVRIEKIPQMTRELELLNGPL